MTDPFQVTPAFLLKLGSLIVHAEEYMSPLGHPVDKETFDTLLASPDVQSWLEALNKDSFLPLKRSARG